MLLPLPLYTTNSFPPPRHAFVLPKVELELYVYPFTGLCWMFPRLCWMFPSWRMTTRLLSPGLPGVQEKVTEPAVLVAVTTKPEGAGGIVGKVTFGPLNSKSAKYAFGELAVEVASAMPTWTGRPCQSGR